MLNDIGNNFYNEKFLKHLEMTMVDFNVNIEVPAIAVLLADIFSVSPKPIVFVIQNEIVESMLNTELKHLVIMDHDHLKYILGKVGIALIPARIFTKDILGIPGLYLITMNGPWPYVDMPKDISEDLDRMGTEQRVITIEEGEKGILVPPDIAKKLWDVDMLLNVFSGCIGAELDHTDKNVCAWLRGQTVQYLKRREVRTVRAKFKTVRAGYEITFI